MKKKFSLEINTPCNEDVNKMIPNSNGFFCNSCVKNVIDLSTKTNSEVAQFIANNKDKNICARLKTSQLGEEFEYNEISKSNNFKYAVAVAASVLLTSNVVSQEKQPAKTEVGCAKPNPESIMLGKVAHNQTVEKVISLTIKGKLLDSKTQKPLNNKLYPNLYFSINSINSEIKINPKTGEFSVSLSISEKNTEVMVNIYSNDYAYSKMIKINTKAIKNGVLKQNIIIDTKEFLKLKIAGGLGVNYIDKKNKNS